jgi:hypothetical protein
MTRQSGTTKNAKITSANGNESKNALCFLRSIIETPHPSQTSNWPVATI